MPFTPAQRRYNWRVALLGIVYAALLAAAIAVLSRHMATGALAYAVAIAPALVVSAFFWLMGRYLVEETDEYLRMLQIRQLLIATGILLTLSTIWGFLEGFGLAPHLVAYLWPMVWIGGLLLGALANRLIERRA